MASQNSSVLISHIYNSRKIVLELMAKQGYNINDYANFSVSEVNSMKQNNQLDMLLETSDDIKKKIYIRYYLAARPAPKNIQEMIDDLFNVEEVLTKEDTLFIIVKDGRPTSTPLKKTVVFEKNSLSIS
jgi:DNA polymerase III delta prime subunit